MQALELPPGARAAAAASIVRKHVLLLQSPPLSENMYFGISLRGYGPGLGRGSQAPRRPGRGGPRHESDLGPGPCRARGFGATRRRAAGPGPSSGAEFRPCSGSGSLPRPGTRPGLLTQALPGAVHGQAALPGQARSCKVPLMRRRRAAGPVPEARKENYYGIQLGA